MATVKCTTTCTDASMLKGSVTLTVNQGTQNIANNTTVLNYTLKTVQNTDANIAFTGTTRPNAGYVDIKINGTTVKTVSFPLKQSTSYSNQPSTTTKGTYTVTHNSNGTKSVTIQAVLRKGAAPSGYSGYLWKAASTSTSSMALTTIPRKATLSAAPDITDTDNPTITYSNPAGSNVSSLQACISFDGTTANIPYRDVSKTGTSYTFSLTTTERTNLQNYYNTSTSGNIYYILKTVIGSSTYTSSLTKTINILECAPSATFSVVDYNSATIALTGNSSKLIKGESKVRYTITPTYYKGATQKSVTYYEGDENTAVTTNVLTEDRTVPAQTSYYCAKIVDSRNLSVTKYVVTDWVDYAKPNLTMTVDKITTSGTTSIKASGYCFRGSFGSYSNTFQLKLFWRVQGASSWSSSTYTDASFTDGKFTITKNLTGLNYKNTYEFYAELKDRLYTITTDVQAVKSVPIFDWGEDDFNINGTLKINGTPLIDIIYPIGSIYVSKESTSPATFLGGTWERVKDTFLLSAGDTYSAGDTGGAATNQLRALMGAINSNTTYLGYKSADAVPGQSYYFGLKSSGGVTVSTINHSTLVTDSEGNESINNMPPYQVVYMWARTG